jgi:opacity protein-like surface antigen
MKKSLANLAIVLSLSPFIAQAKDAYIGAAYTYMAVSDAEPFADSHHGGNVFAGTKITPNLGLELGYSYFLTETTTYPGATLDTAYHLVSLDALGYLPVSPKANLVGLIGAGYVISNFEQKGLINYENGDGTVALRVGGGASVDLNDKLSVRALLKYNYLPDSENIDGLTEFSVGAAYKF